MTQSPISTFADFTLTSYICAQATSLPATPRHHVTMVRVKYRYLVVNFLYPEPIAKTKTPLPDLVQIHAPTPDAFHAGTLMRLIREGVEDLYGDYGAGMVSTGLKGLSHLTFMRVLLTLLQSTTGLPPHPPQSSAVPATTTKWSGPHSHIPHAYPSPPMYQS